MCSLQCLLCSSWSRSMWRHHKFVHYSLTNPASSLNGFVAENRRKLKFSKCSCHCDSYSPLFSLKWARRKVRVLFKLASASSRTPIEMIQQNKNNSAVAQCLSAGEIFKIWCSFQTSLNFCPYKPLQLFLVVQQNQIPYRCVPAKSNQIEIFSILYVLHSRTMTSISFVNGQLMTSF